MKESQAVGILVATDWRAVERESDGAVYLECGGLDKRYHMAADVSFDLELAQRFCSAMNYYNQGVQNV